MLCGYPHEFGVGALYSHVTVLGYPNLYQQDITHNWRLLQVAIQCGTAGRTDHTRRAAAFRVELSSRDSNPLATVECALTHRVKFEDRTDLYSCKDKGSGPIPEFLHSPYEQKWSVQRLHLAVVNMIVRDIGGCTLPSTDTILRPVTYPKSA